MFDLVGGVSDFILLRFAFGLGTSSCFLDIRYASESKHFNIVTRLEKFSKPVYQTTDKIHKNNAALKNNHLANFKNVFFFFFFQSFLYLNISVFAFVELCLGC